MEQEPVWMQSMREVLAWAEVHPDLAKRVYMGYVPLFVAAESAEDLASVASAVGGQRTKQIANGGFEVRRKFGTSEYSRHELIVHGNVCERVQVRTETVPARAEQVVPVYEYHCPPSLLSLSQNGAQS
jgi:hypothetical protein